MGLFIMMTRLPWRGGPSNRGGIGAPSKGPFESPLVSRGAKPSLSASLNSTGDDRYL